MHVLDTLILAVQQGSPSSAGRAIWLFVLLAVLAIALLMINRALRHRLHQDDPEANPTRKSRHPADAWAEAGRRVPLEDDPDVPREPPDDAPHERGFNVRR